MTRVLLTGASGFVGSHALRHFLVNTDWQIVCPVSFRHQGISDRLNVAMEGLDRSRVEIINVDLSAPISKVTAKKFGNIEVIINIASNSDVDESIREPAAFIENNVLLMTSMLDYARTLPNLKVFLHTGTDEELGPAKNGEEHREWMDIDAPSNPYSASKSCQSMIATSYWRTFGVPLIRTRTMNILASTQSSTKLFFKTLNRVLAGESMDIHASPTGVIGSRCYLHARNQADAVLFLVNKALDGEFDSPKLDEISGEVECLKYGDGVDVPPLFHIAGEREVTNLEMAQMIADAVGKPLKYELVDFHSSRPGHDIRYFLESSKIRNLGWEQPVPLDESIRTTVEWTLDHPEWLEA